MIIFLRKIPADTRYQDIEDFIEPAMKGGIFKKSGRIVRIEILALRDTRLNAVEFHALVDIEPEKVGFRVLKYLKGKRFKDRLIIVRQYFNRSWHNDPRQNYQTVPASIMERRIADRRRGKHLEKIQDSSIRFSNAGDFVRKW